MPTKALETAKDFTRKVDSALREHVKPAAEKLDVQLAAEGQAALGLAAGVAAESANLGRVVAAYEAKEKALAGEVADDAPVRTARDEKAGELGASLSQLARAAETSYGRKVLEQLKLAGEVPLVAEQVVTFANGFLSATEKMPELPKPRRSWSVPDLTAARKEIERLTAAVEGELGKLGDELREDEMARTERDAAQTGWHRELRFAADLARAVLRRAGLADLARRVLPSDTALTRLEPEEEEPTVPGVPGESPAAAPASPPGQG